MAVSDKHTPVIESPAADYPVSSPHRDKGLQFLFLDLYRIEVGVHVVRLIGYDGILAHGFSSVGNAGPRAADKPSVSWGF